MFRSTTAFSEEESEPHRLSRYDDRLVTRGKNSASRLLLLAGPLFFISGAAALVLESVWVRLFALSFGTTGLAMATVLTAFMAGLALGGALGGRLADRWAIPRKLFFAYAVMEAAIALCALSMPLFRQFASQVDGSLEGWLSGSLLGLSLGRFFVAFLVLLVPATLMGATLPVLTRALVGNEGSRLARYGGALYAINTWGAVVGAASTPFILLPALGVFGTGCAVAAADLAVAVVAALLSRSRVVHRPTDASSPDKEVQEPPGGKGMQEAERHDRWTARLAIGAIAASGAVAMVYQQVWARILSLIVGSSIYAISLILALFLFGLAAGSALYSRRTALNSGQMSNLAVVHLLVALWGAAVIAFADQLPAVFVVGLRMTGVSVAAVLLLQIFVVSIVVLVPTFFMGMTFPATLHLVARGRSDLGPGRAVGITYSSNTLGAIVGSFVGGFVVLPALGAQTSLLICAFASLGLALVYTVVAAWTSGFRRAIAPLVVVIVIGVLIPLANQPWNQAALSSGVFRVSRSGELARDLDHFVDQEPLVESELSSDTVEWIDRALDVLTTEDLLDLHLGPGEAPLMLSHEAGITATVAVTETRAPTLLEEHDWVTYSLRVNGKADASLIVLSGVPPDDPSAISPQGDAETQTLSGVLAFLLHRGEPRSGLVIGWGSGITVGTALATGLESVRAIEIEREVIDGAAPFQPYAGSPLQNPRLELVEDDGRRYLSSRSERYDLIISEPSNPWITGCSNLFTVEFFELVASRLNEGGRFLQWVQAYEISPRTMASILASVRSVFGSVIVFRPSHSPSDLLIVAGMDDVVIDWDEIEDRLEAPLLARRLRPFGIYGPEDIAARLVLGEAEVTRATRNAELNTDDNLLVELSAPFELVLFRDVGGRRLLTLLGVGPARLPESLAAVSVEQRPRLEIACRRAGREPSYAPPLDLAVSLRELLTARRGQDWEIRDEDLALSELVGHLDDGADRGATMALLGLAAAREGRDHLAVLFMLAHLRMSEDSEPSVRALLSSWAWDAGLTARAWSLQQQGSPAVENENDGEAEFENPVERPPSL